VKNAPKMYNIKFIRRDFKTSVTNTIWFTPQVIGLLSVHIATATIMYLSV